MDSGGGGVGPAFRELMPHFILGTDESCLMASDGGKVKVFRPLFWYKNRYLVSSSLSAHFDLSVLCLKSVFDLNAYF